MTAPKKYRSGGLTKKQLIQSTKKLMADYDYHQITLDQIAKEAGVSKSSIAWHFGNKEGLLVESVFDLFEEIDVRFSEMGEPSFTFKERLAALLGLVGDYFEANPEAKGIAVSLLLDSQVPAEIRQRIQDQWDTHIREIINYLGLDDSYESIQAARGLIGYMHGFYLQWYCHDRPEGMADQMLSAFDAMLNIGDLVSQD